MPEITITVDEIKLNKVVTILENLQPELIKSINVKQTNKKDNAPKQVKSSLDKIELAAKNRPQQNSSKYMSQSTYKNKISKNINDEDGFLDTNVSSGKYLNPLKYKENLKNRK